MRQLFLEDLSGYTETEVKRHLATNYSGQSGTGYTYGEITEDDIKEATKLLSTKKVLIAYESVGHYGCDSSSFFLLQDQDGKLYEIHGRHCSCYGFEGQLDLEETSLAALTLRIKNSELFWFGGYDKNPNKNLEQASQFILGLAENPLKAKQ